MHIWSEIALAVLTQAFYNFKISEAVAFYQAVLVQIEIGTNLQIPVRFGRVPNFAMSYCVWICTVDKKRWIMPLQFYLACFDGHGRLCDILSLISSNVHDLKF